MKMSAREIRARGKIAGVMFANAVANLCDPMTAIGESMGLHDARQQYVDNAWLTFERSLHATSPEIQTFGLSARTLRIYADASKAAFLSRISEALLVAPAGSPAVAKGTRN
jgi:hypothetical protein